MLARSTAAAGLLAAVCIAWSAGPVSGGGRGTRLALIAGAGCAVLATVRLAAGDWAPSTASYENLVTRSVRSMLDMLRAVPWAEGLIIAVLTLEALHHARPWHTGRCGRRFPCSRPASACWCSAAAAPCSRRPGWAQPPAGCGCSPRWPRSSPARWRCRLTSATHCRPARAARGRSKLPRARIEAGEWASGEALPSIASLAGHYDVSRATVAKALRRMADDGLVEILTVASLGRAKVAVPRRGSLLPPRIERPAGYGWRGLGAAENYGRGPGRPRKDEWHPPPAKTAAVLPLDHVAEPYPTGHRLITCVRFAGRRVV